MDMGKLSVDCTKSRSGIEKLAKQKLAAAKCLLDNGHYDDAYYLAGYSIELYLKAMICKTLGIHNFYSFEEMKRKEIVRAYKSHNYEDLFVLSGIQSEFDAAIIEEPGFIKNWSLVNVWNEGTRYLCNKDPDSVIKFINSSEFICTWIQKGE
jgi:hypothetical protein